MPSASASASRSPISAEHGEGMADLYEALAPRVAGAGAPKGDGEAEAEEEEAEGAEEPKALQLAIVGRPNVGKSTLINRLIGEERLLTGPEAGITRDAIAVEWLHRGRPVRLVDTAGMRRGPRWWRSWKSSRPRTACAPSAMPRWWCSCWIPADLLEKQDLTIARLVEEEGRVLIIAVNKWDLVENPKETLARLARPAADLPAAMPGPAGAAGIGQDRPGPRQDPATRPSPWSRSGAGASATPALNRWLEAMEAIPSAAAGQGPAPQAALHHPDQEPPAQLRALLQPAERNARAHTCAIW